MSQRQSTVQRLYRIALETYLFTLVLALYAGTSDPTIHIKHLLSAWAAGALVGSYLLGAWLLRIPLRRPAIFLEALLCLLALLFVSSLLSEFRAISLRETGRFFSLFALYWLATQLYATPAQVLRLFTVFCCAVALAAVYAVMQATGLDPFPWTDTTSDTYTNLPATYGNPNFAAHALILALVMIACIARSGAPWILWLAPLLVFHLYSTHQRAGWIALAGAALLVAIAWALLRRTKHPVRAVTVTLGLFVLLGVLGLGTAMFLTHARTGHALPLDLSLLLRYQSYVSATKMLFDAPFLGHGPAVYGLAYAPYWTPFEQAWFAQEIRMNEHVHNDLLELAIDGGLAAAGLYLTVLVLATGYGLLLAAQGTSPAQRRLGLAFAALFCAFGIDGLFGFNLRVPVTAALFFLMLGALDGLWTHGQPLVLHERTLRPGHLARLAFLALLFLCAWEETRTFASEYQLRTAAKAQRQSQFDAADAAYQKAETYTPWNWDVIRRRGLLELDRRNFDGALAFFERSLQMNPYYVRTHLPMAQANLMLAQQALASKAKEGRAEAATARLDIARSHAEAVLKIAPGFPAADDVLGRIESIAAIVNRDHSASPDPAVQAQHWESARLHLRDAINQGPENAGELYRMLMQVELGLGNVEGAEDALLGAVQVAPDEERTWPLFLKLAREYKRFDRVREVLLQQIERIQAIELPGEREKAQLSTAYGWLAIVREEGFSDLQGALDAYAGSVTADPLRAERWTAFEAWARRQGRQADFENVLRKSCAQLREEDQKPLPQLAAVDLILQDAAATLDEASRTLLAAVRAFPQDSPVPVQVVYGWALQYLNDAYDRLATQNLAPCESSLNLGVSAASLNDLVRANLLFESALACLKDERRAAAAVHWADTLVRLGQENKALSLLEEMEPQFPGHVDLRWAKARSLAHAKRTEEARSIFESLLKESALTPDVRDRLGAELEKLPKGP